MVLCPKFKLAFRSPFPCCRSHSICCSTITSLGCGCQLPCWCSSPPLPATSKARSHYRGGRLPPESFTSRCWSIWASCATVGAAWCLLRHYRADLTWQPRSLPARLCRGSCSWHAQHGMCPNTAFSRVCCPLGAASYNCLCRRSLFGPLATGGLVWRLSAKHDSLHGHVGRAPTRARPVGSGPRCRRSFTHHHCRVLFQV